MRTGKRTGGGYFGCALSPGVWCLVMRLFLFVCVPFGWRRVSSGCPDSDLHEGKFDWGLCALAVVVASCGVMAGNEDVHDCFPGLVPPRRCARWSVLSPSTAHRRSGLMSARGVGHRGWWSFSPSADRESRKNYWESSISCMKRSSRLPVPRRPRFWLILRAKP